MLFNFKRIDYLLFAVFFVVIGFLEDKSIFLLGCLLLIYFFLRQKLFIPRKLFILPYWPIVVYLSLFSIFQIDLSFFDFSRNILNFMSPIIFILLGAYAAYFIDLNRFFRLIITTSFILSCIHFLNLFFSFGTLTNLNSLRGVIGVQIDVVPLALAILLFRKNFGFSINDWQARIYELVFLLLMVVMLSRTMFISLIIYLTFFILKTKKGKTKKIISLSIVAIVFAITLFSVIPNSFRYQFFQKALNSFSEISSYHSWNSNVEITQNWRGFENFTASQKFNNYTILEKIFGGGIGQGIFVGPYSILVGVDDGFLPYFHNGYYTLLIKGGWILLFYYVSFLIINWSSFLFGKQLNSSAVSSIVVSIFLTFAVNTFFTMGPFINGSSTWLLIILGYFALQIKNLISKRKTCEV